MAEEQALADSLLPKPLNSVMDEETSPLITNTAPVRRDVQAPKTMRVLLPLLGILFIVTVVVTLGILSWKKGIQEATGHGPSFPRPEPAPPASPQPTQSPSEPPSPQPQPQPPKVCSWSNYRLPDWVHPKEYRLDIDVDLEPPFPVAGKLEIDLSVNNETQCVLIHAQNMDIINAVILESGKEGSMEWDSLLRRVMITFPSNLPMPSATLSMKFNYTLNKIPAGFYQTHYQDRNKDSKTLAVTQFESEAARMAFPCFDEPAMKATFGINVTTAAGLTCLSNMPEAHSLAISSRAKHVFKVSPKMSTYLVAWVVGELDSVHKDVETMEGLKSVKVWATPDRSEEANGALEAVSQILPYYENLLGTPYPLPKLDLVAVKGSNGPRGMENWGIITIRENSLLLSTSYSTSSDWIQACSVIAHEVAHMWFGDLVTMEWWSDLWLNEGFATYWQYIGGQVCLSGTDPFEWFLANANYVAFLADQSSKSHPLVLVETVDGRKLVDDFDHIVYQKGASILRTLHTYIRSLNQPTYGPRPMLKTDQDSNDSLMMALHDYLVSYEFGSVQTKNLLESLTKSTGLPIKTWMQKWTYKSGHPIVSVDIDSELQEFIVKQNPSDGSKCEDNNSWWIPLHYATKGNPTPKWTTLESCEPLSLGKASAGDHAIVNLGRLGHYQVNYSKSTLTALMESASETNSSVGVYDVAGLLIDTKIFSMRDPQSLKTFLELCQTLGIRLDQAYGPWNFALSQLKDIGKLISLNSTNCAERFIGVVRETIVGPIASTVFSFKLLLPGNGVDYGRSALHELVLDSAVIFKYQIAIYTGLASLRSGHSPPVDFRKATYRAGAIYGEPEIYSDLREMLLKTDNARERWRLMSGLAAVNSTRVNETLNLSLTEYVQPQEVVYLISELGRANAVSASMALDFVKENHLALYTKLGSWDQIAEIALLIAKHFGTKSESEMRAFFGELSDHLKKSDEDEALRMIQETEEWVTTYEHIVCDWVDEKIEEMNGKKE